MNKTLLKLAARAFVAGVIAIVSATVAHADERIVAKVPFAFVVGDRQLPAGDYVVKELSDDAGVLAITSVDGRRFVYTLTIPASSGEQATKPELVFEKFGNQYFLSQVMPQGGDSREIVLTPSIMERNMVKSAGRAN
jgi:hypothetical protein